MRNHEERRELFNSGEKDLLTCVNGYAERPVSWFEENILPDFLKVTEKIGSINHLLEVGCAMGYYSKVLAKHFSQVIAVDFAPARIDEARQYNSAPNINYLLVDVVNENIPQFGPFNEYSYDCAISSAVYQHIDPTNGDRKKAFEHTFKVLKPGGYLVLYDEKFDIRPEVWGDFYEPMKESWIQENLSEICTLESCDFITRGLHGEHEFRWILRKK